MHEAEVYIDAGAYTRLLTAIISRFDRQLLGNKLSSCTMFHEYFI